MTKKRQDTTLESEGAEFLALGNLLTHGIAAYKAYVRNAGHDLVAVNPSRHTSARIEVKSRWASDAHWNMGMKAPEEVDFYVYVRLNRGNRYQSGAKKCSAPQFYVIPAQDLENLPKTGWGQARLKKLSNLDAYQDRWDLVRNFLEIPAI